MAGGRGKREERQPAYLRECFKGRRVRDHLSKSRSRENSDIDFGGTNEVEFSKSRVVKPLEMFFFFFFLI